MEYFVALTLCAVPLVFLSATLYVACRNVNRLHAKAA